MADETTTTTAPVTEATKPNDAQATGATTVAPPADATGTNSGTSDRTFTQADIDRIIKDRLEQERGKSEKAAQKAQADAEAKVLAEQGKYKELFEKQQAELQTAQSEAKSAATKLLQQQAATDAGFPLKQSHRLKGETLEEMVADAKAFLAELPKPVAPNINADNGAGGVPAAGQLTDAEKQELGARLGVNPKFIQ